MPRRSRGARVAPAESLAPLDIAVRACYPPSFRSGEGAAIERYWRSLVSGERRGLFASLLRAGLAAVSLLYLLTVKARAALYARGLLRRRRIGWPVVSVGNITAGGTGKTPLVEYLARRMVEQGTAVGIVSRGYRPIPGEGGANDEALVLHENLGQVPQFFGKDRFEASRRAVDEAGCRLVLLDDGFQHLALERDLDVVVIDATNPFGYGFLLPRGMLREPIDALKRAHILAISRAELCPHDRLATLRAFLGRVAPDAGIVELSSVATAVVRLDDGSRYPPEWLRGRRIYGFCAIGNPTAFRLTLERAGAFVKGFRSFPDHHPYGAGDLGDLDLAAREFEAEALVATQKDIVKLRGLASRTPVYGLRIQAVAYRGEERFDAALEPLLRRSRAVTAGRGV